MANPDENAAGHDLLVVGYGNELRCDDGVGPKVAAALQEMKLPGVRTITCHQLTPELAEPVSQARRVVFVDAAVDAAAGIQWRELRPAATGRIMAHAAAPSLDASELHKLHGRPLPDGLLADDSHRKA